MGRGGPITGPAAHRAGATTRMPPHGWPHRLRRAVDASRTRDSCAAPPPSLPAAAWRPGSTDRPATLVHGDWHLGQLGRRTRSRRGCSSTSTTSASAIRRGTSPGPPGSGRPGLIPDDDWTAFLDAYRDADGPALTAGDPWPVLEPFARAAVVQAAANHPDDELLVAPAPGWASWRRTACRSPACGSACCRGDPSRGRSRSRSPAALEAVAAGGLDEPVLHLGERLQLAEVQEDALAGVALLQVDAVALVGLHDACALRTQQRVPCTGRWSGLRGFVWRDAHGRQRQSPR